MSTDETNDDTIVELEPVDAIPPTPPPPTTNGDPDTDKPGDYFESHHHKWLLKRRFVCVMFGLFLFASYLIGYSQSADFRGLFFKIGSFLLIVGLFGCWYAWKRFDKIWEMRPLELRVDEGIFTHHNRGVLIPWAMTNSEAEQYPLDKYRLSTPRQTTWEQFWPAWNNCGTLEITNEQNEVVAKFRDVKDIRRMLDAYSWRESAPIRQQRRDLSLREQEVDAQARTADALEESALRNVEIRDLLVEIRNILTGQQPDDFR